MTDRDAIEKAYGFLWQLSVDRGTRRGRLVSLARQQLLLQLDKAGQARGITTAKHAMELATDAQALNLEPAPIGAACPT